MKIFRPRRKGFTLIEILVAISIAAFAFVGMISAVMSYLKIWKSVSGGDANEEFDKDVIIRSFFRDQIAVAMKQNASEAGGKSIGFCNDAGKEGEGVVLEDNFNCLYWKSNEILPFVHFAGDKSTEDTHNKPLEDIQYWIQYENKHNIYDGEKQEGPLFIHYKAKIKGSSNYVTGKKLVTDKCKGINFGYLENEKMVYSAEPRRGGSSVNSFLMPNTVQILLVDEKGKVKEHTH